MGSESIQKKRIRGCLDSAHGRRVDGTPTREAFQPVSETEEDNGRKGRTREGAQPPTPGLGLVDDEANELFRRISEQAPCVEGELIGPDAGLDHQRHCVGLGTERATFGEGSAPRNFQDNKIKVRPQEGEKFVGLAGFEKIDQPGMIGSQSGGIEFSGPDLLNRRGGRMPTREKIE